MWGYTLRWLISFKFFQAIEQGRANLRSLAYQHQHFGIFQPRRERVEILRVVIPHRDLVPLQFFEARERAQSVEVIVEYRDLHLQSNHDIKRGAGHRRQWPVFLLKKLTN